MFSKWCLFPVGAEGVSKLCHLPVVLERFTCVRSDEHRIASHEEGVSNDRVLWCVHTARHREQ